MKFFAIKFHSYLGLEFHPHSGSDRTRRSEFDTNKLQYAYLFVITGDNVDCWMEIQHGKGPWAPPVSGIVPLGSTLTLVVAINDYRGKFVVHTRC